MASTSTSLWPVSSLRKRRHSRDSISDDDEHVIKYHITLEKEQEHLEDTGSESIYTVQDKSTMIVADTTDTDWSESDLEYDVISLQDGNPDHPFMFDENITSTSEESEAETVRLEDIPVNETDCAADSSSDCGTFPFSDPELSPADFWNCAQCNAKNNNPLFRYCERCFKVRKEFFPARPKGHKKRNVAKSSCLSNRVSDSESESSSSDALDEPKESVPSCSQSTATTKDTHLGSSSDSEAVESSTDSKVRNYVQQISLSTDSGISDITSDSKVRNYVKQISTDSGASDVTVDNLDENRKCNICFQNPKNAGFFHGGKVHVYCCYKCAKKVWMDFKKCPICNRKVSCVVRLIFS